ncbi:MAG: adenylate/guanylate cyclase domain-containing protein [Actinobacteria bacterium]|nr:MAG: adenylate/guanylate cyclase domain-containing protein [Actinomycetota bacterium]
MEGATIGAQARARAGDVVRQIGGEPGELETVALLLELGVAPEAMRRARERGRLEDAIFDAVLDPDRQRRTVSPREIEARGGTPAAELAVVIQAAGLPAPELDEPYFTEEEAQIFFELARLREVWPPELALQISRVAGRALARIAQAQVQAFRLYVEPRLREQAGDSVAALPEVHWAFERLLPLAAPYLVSVHRRLFERELTEVAIREAEVRAGGELLPGAARVAILFCDLKDFTAYADTAGEEAAIRAIEHLAQVVTQECGSTGRVVKGLGDGYMLAFPDADDAVRTGLGVIEHRRDEVGPGVHASLHQGVAVAHDGDYFGTVVNVAARILDVARRDELVATSAVAEATSSAFAWKPVGGRFVRGLGEPVQLCRLVGRRPVA